MDATEASYCALMVEASCLSDALPRYSEAWHASHELKDCSLVSSIDCCCRFRTDLYVLREFAPHLFDTTTGWLVVNLPRRLSHDLVGVHHDDLQIGERT